MSPFAAISISAALVVVAFVPDAGTKFDSTVLHDVPPLVDF